MTEEEAKTKWCPMARVRIAYEGAATAANRGTSAWNSEIVALTRCIGSACMAWREQRDTATRTRVEDGQTFTETRGVVLGGFCGLAGAPQ